MQSQCVSCEASALVKICLDLDIVLLNGKYKSTVNIR